MGFKSFFGQICTFFLDQEQPFLPVTASLQSLVSQIGQILLNILASCLTFLRLKPQIFLLAVNRNTFGH